MKLSGCQEPYFSFQYSLRLILEEVNKRFNKRVFFSLAHNESIFTVPSNHDSPTLHEATEVASFTNYLEATLADMVSDRLFWIKSRKGMARIHFHVGTPDKYLSQRSNINNKKIRTDSTS